MTAGGVAEAALRRLLWGELLVLLADIRERTQRAQRERKPLGRALHAVEIEVQRKIDLAESTYQKRLARLKAQTWSASPDADPCIAKPAESEVGE